MCTSVYFILPCYYFLNFADDDTSGMSAVVVTLDRLLFDDETVTLEFVFTLVGLFKTGLPSRESAGVIETYLLHMLLGETAGCHTTHTLLIDVLRQAVPGWDGISHFVRGEIIAVDFARCWQPGT